MKINDLDNLSKKYRKQLFEKFLLTKQGHPGSIFSMMEIVVTLYYGGYVRFNKKKKIFKDKVLISKGHATATLYPILRDFGLIKQKDWNNWGSKNSLLKIFGNISIPGIDITSGSLGHCIGAGAGMALHYKRSKIDKKVYVIISEGELYEGSTWEALLFAKHHELSNLIIFIDVNSLIILGSTDECLRLDPIQKKVEGLGIECFSIDGHNISEITNSLDDIGSQKKLSCIIANTVKGKGSTIMEHKKNWHYWNPMSKEEIKKTREELKE